MTTNGQDFNDMLGNAAPGRIADLVEGVANHFDETPHPGDGQGSPEGVGISEKQRADMDAVDRAFAPDDAIDDDLALAAGLDPRDDAAKVSKAAVALCVNEPPNDTGNGKRLLHHFGDEILHVREVGWHVWTGTRWKLEGGEEAVKRLAQIVAARIVLEADAITASPSEVRTIEIGDEAKIALDALEKSGVETDEDKAKARELKNLIANADGTRKSVSTRKITRRKYAISSGNGGKLGNMIDCALPHCSVAMTELDADPLALNLANGTLYFVEGFEDDPDGNEATGFKRKKWRAELRPHNRRDLITKVAPVEYDPKALAPNFVASMLKFQPIEATRNFLQRFHGYALTGKTGEQCLVFNFGDGANWKSTFMEVVARVMGDYSSTLNFESIAGDAQKSGAQASPDIARLPGARLVRSSEPGRGVPFKESLIKSLTGGEPILTRHNFGNFFEFTPNFKMVLAGNHKPEIGGVDHGIWRRIRFVMWPTKILDGERRMFDDVIAELWVERSGIMNWLVAGALDYFDRGLRTPQEVIDSTNDYREEMDPVGCFIGDCVTSIPAPADGAAVESVPCRAMYEAFVAWCWENSVRAWKEKGFATAMSQKGFLKERLNSNRRYINVKLHDVPIRPRATQGSHEPPHPADNYEAVPI